MQFSFKYGRFDFASRVAPFLEDKIPPIIGCLWLELGRAAVNSNCCDACFFCGVFKHFCCRLYCMIWQPDSSCAEPRCCKIYRRPQPCFFFFFFLCCTPVFPLFAWVRIFCLYHWVKHIPWPHLVPAWDVWLGIARLVPAQRFHGTGRRKHSVVTAPTVMIKNVALSWIGPVLKIHFWMIFSL